MEPILVQLAGRIHLPEVHRIARDCEMQWRAEGRSTLAEQLIDVALSGNGREAYNALWILTHLPAEMNALIEGRRSAFIDHLLSESGVGCRRLLLSLLNKLQFERETVRTDFLDYCLSRINSCEPYANRAFCLYLAYKMCSNFPELMRELCTEIEMMSLGEMSPGLVSARKMSCAEYLLCPENDAGSTIESAGVSRKLFKGRSRVRGSWVECADVATFLFFENL